MKQIKKLENIARLLEPTEKTMNKISESATEYIKHFIEHLPEMPGYQTGQLDQLKAFTVQETSRTFEEILHALRTEVDTIGLNSAGGTHMGYIPGGGLWTSSIADMLAAATNRYAGVSFASPGAVEIENQIIRWMTTLVGYPSTAHGNLTSGGSIANMIAIQTARDHKEINSRNIRQSVIYVTLDVHHCIYKALNITGLHEAVIRIVPQNAKHQMNVDLFHELIESDIRQGHCPFLVVATAGTTDTGAIDPLNEIVDLCDKYNIWFHVDAAYGGFFMLLDEMKDHFKGIQRSDSLVMDPHKTLFIPYGSGVVLVRDKRRLLKSNVQKAAYMIDTYDMDDINPSDTGPELSKHFRGLRIWLPLQLHGLAPFKANLEEKLLLSRYFHEQVKKLGFEVGPAPQLTVTAFRIKEGDKNSINEQLIKSLHSDGRVFFSSTMIEDKLWIRCAILSHRTHMNEVESALSMLKQHFDKFSNE